MKMLSLSDDDLQLLKAIKPFMSKKSQELLDVMVTFLNVFKPKQPNEKINVDALTSLLSMLQETFESKKSAKINGGYEVVEEQAETEEQNYDIPSETKDIEALLNVLAEKNSKS